MSKWMPPKLYFSMVIRNGVVCHPQVDNVSDNQILLSKQQFDVWYDREIAPLFENAVEVWGNVGMAPFFRHDFGNLPAMYPDGSPLYKECVSDSSHKALLIKIEPLKEETAEETAEDLLRELVEAIANAGIIEYCGPLKLYNISLAKVRAFLERQK